ncbi:uncharacterized protein LOC141818269 [Curcuma longa]|uniref:uncharacterized protein LOC141818269 n=1 Tax=Curcuma longa TaxID=136217 RepID=UPI003D9E25FB
MEKEMGVAPIDGVPAVPGRDGHGRPLLHLMWVGFSAMAFWAGELLRALPLAQGGGGGAAVHLLVPYVMWLLALVVTLTAVARRTLPRAVVIDVADHRLASFLSMAVFAGGLLRALAEVEADDEALLVDAAAVARLVGAYAIFLLALVATLMPVVVGLPRRAIPSATFMLLSAVIWYHLQLWLP